MADNFFFNGIIAVETLLLLFSVISKKDKINQMIYAFLLIAFFVLSLFILTKQFDKNIFSISTVESIQIRERKEFYGEELDKLYKNKIGIFYFDNLRRYFGKVSSNLFSILDLNTYFSSGSFKEGKYPLFFAPLFIAGFLFLLTNDKKTPIVYLIIALSAGCLINPNSKFKLLLVLPLINLCIAMGVITIFGMMKKKSLDNLT